MVITRWAVKFNEFSVDVYSFYIRYFLQKFISLCAHTETEFHKKINKCDK